MGGTPIGNFRKANGTLFKMDSHNDSMHMASCIFSLELQYKWMLNATPLANGIENLNWIVHFHESSSWLTVWLLQETFNYILEIDNNCTADGINVLGSDCGAGFTQVADPYKKGPEFRSLVHCTPMTWVAYILPLIVGVGKLTRATQTSDIVIRQPHHNKTLGRLAFAVLS